MLMNVLLQVSRILSTLNEAIFWYQLEQEKHSYDVIFWIFIIENSKYQLKTEGFALMVFPLLFWPSKNIYHT